MLFFEQSPKKLIETRLGQFRLIAFAEGWSYLLLGITMPLKYGFDITTPNYIVGMAHGLLFVLYLLFLALVSREKNWDFITIGLAFIASLIPFGTFVADKKIFRKYAQ